MATEAALRYTFFDTAVRLGARPFSRAWTLFLGRESEIPSRLSWWQEGPLKLTDADIAKIKHEYGDLLRDFEEAKRVI